ncbi:MAG: hypothetical protein H0T21_01745 [Gemmatimonadaceae bacterium]|nr:hypothetical protein [Gemmatimonadaceae bacterium]
MRVEQIPIILGVLVALIGLAFIYDAWTNEGLRPGRERRRRTRAVPQKAGQTLIGLGTLCMAAALIGRDTWRYGTISVLAGVMLVLVGAVMNRVYLKEVLFFRGAARRGDGGDGGHTKEKEPREKSRIR